MFGFGKNYRVCVQWAYCGPESALYNSARSGSVDACTRSVNPLVENKPPRITAHFDKRSENVRAGTWKIDGFGRGRGTFREFKAFTVVPAYIDGCRYDGSRSPGVTWLKAGRYLALGTAIRK